MSIAMMPISPIVAKKGMKNRFNTRTGAEKKDFGYYTGNITSGEFFPML